MQSSFWHQELDCPFVYVAGTCFPSEDDPKRASYGVCWGFQNPKNKSAGLIIRPTKLRAELAGVLRALKTAYSQKIDRLVIYTKSAKLNAELELWDQMDLQEKLRFENSDLLIKMDKLREQAKDYMYWQADVPSQPFQHARDFSRAVHFASLNASGKFLTLKNEPEKTDMVAIFGACHGEGGLNPKASWAVFWGVGDDRNDKGFVDGKQTHLRAEFCALRSALRSAIRHNLPQLHVFTRNASVKSFSGPENTKKSMDAICAECKVLAQELGTLTVEHVVATIEHAELDEAKAMAKDQTVDDCSENLTNFSETMDKMDQMILGADHHEEYEVTIRVPKVTKKKKAPKETPAPENTVYKQTSSGGIEVHTYQNLVSNQRPLKVNGYQRADGVQVFLGRT